MSGCLGDLFFILASRPLTRSTRQAELRVLTLSPSFLRISALLSISTLMAAVQPDAMATTVYSPAQTPGITVSPHRSSADVNLPPRFISQALVVAGLVSLLAILTLAVVILVSITSHRWDTETIFPPSHR